ncbi:MgtC/SapB family protein [Actinospica durhamensis]|uniref:MgtC/SapB family protein n=1 Tax=Actinospica durhamensis TaxID=1508375 RepID=A0A941ETB9_9ACTN|nr:MgtC/SapB family protein [Actinospica durhamensis]MBR7837707.1 MgtC/SapB family protein [Actinospica durhamensis]
MHSAEWAAAINIAIGWVLTFILGFEREVRGAPAGDRTFSMIGLSAALIGTVAPHYPAVLGGAVTGIGFIGGGLCFRQAVKQQDQEREILHGVTTAASIFGAAAIGAIAGCGQLLVATVSTVGLLLSLEIRHIPVLRYMDARRWAHLFNDDSHRHFKLHDLEHALMHPHPHQEHSGFSQTTSTTTVADGATIATVTPASAAEASSTVMSDTASAEENETLVKEAEAASILANQVMVSGAMRSTVR